MSSEYNRLQNEKETRVKTLSGRIFFLACFLFLCLFILYLSIPTSSWKLPEAKKSDIFNLFNQEQPVTIWPRGPADTGSPKKNVTIFAATKWYKIDLSLNIIGSQCSKEIQDFCRITLSPNESATADAFLFHNRDYNESLYPKYRNLSQVYVMLTSESPVHEKIDFLSNQINWTMNYRRDSDVHYPYVIMKRKDKPETVDYEWIWNQKNSSLTAAWMVTNCYAGNKRKDIAEKAIKEGLALDIFGNCGKKLEKCGRFDPEYWACPTKLMRTYKFYLSFENSNCPDYVTEKLSNALNLYYAIPIVLQRKKYENIGIPSDSFIAVDDFSSLKELAAFINELQNDKQRYLEYFKWRETFNVRTADDSKGFCDLCQKLRNGNKPRQSYPDLQRWYSGDTCDTEALFHYVEQSAVISGTVRSLIGLLFLPVIFVFWRWLHVYRIINFC